MKDLVRHSISTLLGRKMLESIPIVPVVLHSSSRILENELLHSQGSGLGTAAVSTQSTPGAAPLRIKFLLIILQKNRSN